MSVEITDSFRKVFRADLLETYMLGWSQPSEADLQDHIENRYRQFRDYLVPWVDQVAPIAGTTWIEVGSGTGSSTLALTEFGATIHTYEISKPSIAAARRRFDFFGVGDNVVEHYELFDDKCAQFTSGEKVDGVFLIATLEHMTFQETQDVLKTSWNILKDGGVLVVGDTPNRLSAMDYHTSYLPFFQMLPPKVRLEYAKRSPRKDFVNAFTSANRSEESLTRWGNGISFHEFELALGADISERVIANGFERLIAKRWPLVHEDEVLVSLFNHYKLTQNIGFARHNLFLVFQK